MLTDAARKSLKPKKKPYKVADRDGMYVMVLPTGGLSFRYDYRFNNRRETLTLGAYGPAALSLARAREPCLEARKAVRDGQSPALEKQRAKRRLKEAESFGQFGRSWLDESPMADSTRAMRRSVFMRDIEPLLSKRLLSEVTPERYSGCAAKWLQNSTPRSRRRSGFRRWLGIGPIPVVVRGLEKYGSSFRPERVMTLTSELCEQGTLTSRLTNQSTTLSYRGES